MSLDDILTARAQGATLAAIGAAHGVTRQAVHYRLKRAGHTTPADYAGRRQALVEDAAWLTDAGATPSEMVTRLGYASVQSLARALRRAGRDDLARYVESGRRS